MCTPETSARLRFLTDAAYTLLPNAPETSRHLMLRRNTLISENELSTVRAHTRNSCRACGTLMILGWEGTLQVERPRRKRKRNGRNTTKGSRTMVYECSTCGEKTRESLNQSPKRTTNSQAIKSAPRRLLTAPLPEQRSIATVDSDSQPNKSSTRKRAKTKKPGYLQALLASKQALETKSGFDLLDFMKKA